MIHNLLVFFGGCAVGSFAAFFAMALGTAAKCAERDCTTKTNDYISGIFG